MPENMGLKTKSLPTAPVKLLFASDTPPDRNRTTANRRKKCKALASNSINNWYHLRWQSRITNLHASEFLYHRLAQRPQE
jgi:hypothetical protein